MKFLTRIGLAAILLCTGIAYALDPIQGFYGGIIGEMSHGPSNYNIMFPDVSTTFVAKIQNSALGGGAGGILGYRMSNFRVEGEAIYNYIPAYRLAFGDCRLVSPSIVTPLGVCPEADFAINKTGFNGSNTALLGFVNAYFDFYIGDGETALVPFVGLGAGAGRIQSRINLVNTLVPTLVLPTSAGASASITRGAYQGILGVSYFLDDYTWAGIDFRYIAVGSFSNSNTNDKLIILDNIRYSLQTLNFTVNFSFDNSTN